MRSIILVVSICGVLGAQESPAPAPQPAAQPAPAPVVTLDIAPLAAPDLESPYASPRDAARHRLQASLTELRAARNTRAAMQGFTEALLLDRTYAIAAFNLGVVAAIAEKWQDALAALEESARLDPNVLGKAAAPQIERLRLICSLETTADGKRKRQYDEALYPVLAKLPKLAPADAIATLTEIGRIDPKRWEAPALLAAINGNGHGYDVAAKFLEIAVANATDPAIKARLQKGLHAAERELRYAAARISADATADKGEYDKAAELYEAAWTAIPARSSNGMQAAAAWLLHDDTSRAAGVLVRLRDSGNEEFVVPAVAMLKELEPIEPGAKARSSDAGQFFRDAGPAQPVRISDLVPPVNAGAMEILARPLPALVQDPEPVLLLAALSANPADAAQASALPVLAAPRVAGENPWRELSQLRGAMAPADPTKPQDHPMQTADISAGARTHRLLQVMSEPPGARVFASTSSDSICQTPCDIQAGLGSHTLRVSLPGYEDEIKVVHITAAKAELPVVLKPIRGSVLVETSGPATLKVNDTTIANPAPVELALIPGLYRVTADFGATARERTVNVKPGAKLHLSLQP
ncbi:MAG TPA: PEGA domain-containing protein [Bryobacteraceae bacterium]|nr:PEGA domain-containing protein [Bryobacteraceae bacterium]